MSLHTMCWRERWSSRRRTGISRPAQSSSTVVDPGVGSARRGIAAEAGDYRFVAPDNGVLTVVLDEHAGEESRRADRAAVCAPDRQPHVRGTRSVRAGSRLAGQGHRPRALGRPAGSDAAARDPPAGVAAASLDGEVLRVDRFGNLITNIDRRTFESSPPAARSPSASATARSRASCRPTPTRTAVSCPRCSAAPTISRWLSTAASAAAALAARPRRPGCGSPRARDTMLPLPSS